MANNYMQKIIEDVAKLTVKVETILENQGKTDKKVDDLSPKVEALYVTLMGNPSTKDIGRIVVYDEATGFYLLMKKYWVVIAGLYLLVTNLWTIGEKLLPLIGPFIKSVVAGTY